MQEAVGGLANLNGQWVGDSSELSECFQPPWGKGLSESGAAFPVKGTMG